MGTDGPARLVVASSNEGKIAELVALLGDRYAVERRPDGLAETVEDGLTLEANAIKKAQEVRAATGATALADDTGLFVAALAGAPGVHTARYAGPEATDADNLAKLLRELAAADDRSAEFRTVVAVARDDGGIVLASGTVAGRIATESAGEWGFGYDPVFIPAEGDGRTFAEMTTAEKNRISHRARALAALQAELDA